MAILTDWYFSAIMPFQSDSDEFLMKGFVSGHPKLTEGLHIRTSPVRSVEVNGTSLRVSTKNTEYVCDFDKIDALDERALMNMKACLKKYNLESCIEELEKISERRHEERRELDKSIASTMQANSVYLELSNMRSLWFSRAFYVSDDMTIIHLDNVPHIGMFTDSCLIMSDDGTMCPVRYFPQNDYGIEFYHQIYDIGEVEDNTYLGIIKNIGTETLRIEFTWGKKLELGAGEFVEVYQGVTGIAVEDNYTEEDFVDMDTVNEDGADNEI